MKKSIPESSTDSLTTAPEQLRKRAEINLQKIEKKPQLSNTDKEIEHIIHELQIHQVELEMQNEELQQANSQYFDLYEHAPAAYLTLKTNGLIVESNLTAVKLFAMTKSSLNQKRLSDLILPADQDIFYLHCQRLVKNKANDSCELRLFLPDKRLIDVRLESSMTNNSPKQFRTLITDISQRKLLENKLEQSQLRFQTIVNTATNAIIIIDDQASYSYLIKRPKRCSVMRLKKSLVITLSC